MGTQFNDPEGTEDFWALNPNVIKSNFQFSLIDHNYFITEQLKHQCPINFYTHYSSIGTNGQQTGRLTELQRNRNTDQQTEK